MKVHLIIDSDKELITTYDSEKKFLLQEQIKDLEKKIEEFKKRT
jgi:hypothetical protein